ncbi:hypothetical protein ZIOFF_033778 [Zingiber officinale]|uniref:Uncharacterized protein n=1 Tax=Zingiber officinale TaxID=94328 RepID=A0A8J5H2R3_ZINOF|nr:hypothetical protein ZIOFF_033778 [Zingiber officinale]
MLFESAPQCLLDNMPKRERRDRGGGRPPRQAYPRASQPRLRGKKLKVDAWFGSRKTIAAIRTTISHVGNLVTGVTKGYRYKMRLVYAYFPINASIPNNSTSIGIRKFLGEKKVRKVDMLEAALISQKKISEEAEEESEAQDHQPDDMEKERLPGDEAGATVPNCAGSSLGHMDAGARRLRVAAPVPDTIGQGCNGAALTRPRKEPHLELVNLSMNSAQPSSHRFELNAARKAWLDYGRSALNQLMRQGGDSLSDLGAQMLVALLDEMTSPWVWAAKRRVELGR